MYDREKYYVYEWRFSGKHMNVLCHVQHFNISFNATYIIYFGYFLMYLIYLMYHCVEVILYCVLLELLIVLRCLPPSVS